MKNLATLILSVVVLVSIAGCKSGLTFIKIDDGKEQEHVSSGFDSETYVWESWLYSTNRVDLNVK